MKSNNKVSTQEKNLSNYGKKTPKSVRKLVNEEPEAILGNLRQDMNKMDLIEGNSETKCPFGRISPIQFAFKGSYREVSEEQGEINQINGILSQNEGPFQKVNLIGISDPLKGENCGSRRSLCLEAESERIQHAPKKTLNFRKPK